MDCCNFMSYRPPYYGTPYYENIPYPADYYGHPYQDYYGTTSPYYTQPWQCAAPFTDYVYNPKEARIRKAMREASRERALGVAPMPSPRGARRSTTWNFSEEEQLMMAPAHAMRGIIGPPMCTSPGFPISTTGNGPFMQSVHYNKHVHHMPHTSGSYMQTSPINQLPLQSEIWHPYEDSLRNTSTGPYMMPSQIPPYQQPQGVPSPALLPPDKPKLEPESFPNGEDTQMSHTNENVPPNVDRDKMMNEPVFENKLDSIQPLIESGNMQASEPFMPTYTENVMAQHNRYEKNDEMKMKKTAITSQLPFGEGPSHLRTSVPQNCPTGPLSHANIKLPYAISGGGVNSALILNQETQYHKEYIRKYLESSECDTMEILIGGNDVNNGFSYVTYTCPQMHQYDFMNTIDINDIFMLENFNANCCDCESNSEVLNLSMSKNTEEKKKDTTKQS